MKLIKVVIKGIEFEGYFTSPDVLARCEKALDTALEEARHIEKYQKDSDAVRKQCMAICTCADEILGAGSSEKLFPDGLDLLDCLDVYEELCEMKEKQIIPLINAKVRKYSLARARREK